MRFSQHLQGRRLKEPCKKIPQNFDLQSQALFVNHALRWSKPRGIYLNFDGLFTCPSTCHLGARGYDILDAYDWYVMSILDVTEDLVSVMRTSFLVLM